MYYIFGAINWVLGCIWGIIEFIVTLPFRLLGAIIDGLLNFGEYLGQFEYIGLTLGAMVAIAIFMAARKK